MVLPSGVVQVADGWTRVGGTSHRQAARTRVGRDPLLDSSVECPSCPFVPWRELEVDGFLAAGDNLRDICPAPDLQGLRAGCIDCWVLSRECILRERHQLRLLCLCIRPFDRRGVRRRRAKLLWKKWELAWKLTEVDATLKRKLFW